MALHPDAKKKRNERPLTPEEADFAAEHVGLVWSYISAKHLEPAEWFDVLSIRYIQTVKRWHEEPELWQWSFSTIVWRALRSTEGSERGKQSRRIQAVSLHETIPGTDILRIDTIAAGY